MAAAVHLSRRRHETADEHGWTQMERQACELSVLICVHLWLLQPSVVPPGLGDTLPIQKPESEHVPVAPLRSICVHLCSRRMAPEPQANTGPDAARYGDRGTALRGACWSGATRRAGAVRHAGLRNIGPVVAVGEVTRVGGHWARYCGRRPPEAGILYFLLPSGCASLKERAGRSKGHGRRMLSRGKAPPAPFQRIARPPWGRPVQSRRL